MKVSKVAQLVEACNRVDLEEIHKIIESQKEDKDFEKLVKIKLQYTRGIIMAFEYVSKVRENSIKLVEGKLPSLYNLTAEEFLHCVSAIEGNW